MSGEGRDDGVTKGGLAAGIGAVTIVVGATLPWIALPTPSDPPQSGLSIFGPLVPMFGFAVLAGLLAWRWTTPAKFVASLAGVVALGLTVVAYAGTTGTGPLTPRPATGLFVTMLGAALSAISGSVSILLEPAPSE